MKKIAPSLVIFLVLFGAALMLVLNWPKKNETPERISGAYRALNFWSQQRAYPNASIPDVGHFAAYNQYRRQIHSIRKKPQTPPPWQAIGPHNLGGRTLAIAFNPQNPNTIYAGSASGGLWRSKSAGRGPSAWEYVPTGFPVLAISSIAFAPGDSNTIYIGTGEVYNYQSAGTGAAYRSTRGTYGIGILKSTDGGATWTHTLNWGYNQRRGVWAVKINPLNPNTVWAATTEGVYKSKDAGSTWQQVHQVIMANDLVINPVDTNTVVVGCGNFGSAGMGIYRTTDGGSTWTQATGALPSTFFGKIQLDIYRASPNILYASIGNGFSSSNGASWLCRSTDGGATWTLQSSFDYSKWQGWYSHDVAVNQTNPDEVFAIGIEIYKSTNAGVTLVQKATTNWYVGRIPPEGPEGPPTYAHADNHDVVYHPTNPSIIYFANDGGVFRSIDGGDTFESCNGGYQTGQFYNGFSSSPHDSLLSIGGLQDNSTAIYDGQTAWIVHLIGGDGAWTAFDPFSSNVMYGSWQGLSIMRSNDSGQSWFPVVPPGSNFTLFIAPFVHSQSSPQTLYAGRDVVFKTTNGGITWTPTNGGQPLDGNAALAMAISGQTSHVVYTATAPYQFNRGRVFRTQDGGISWVDITGNLPDRFFTDLAVDPGDDSRIIVTLSGFGSSHIFKSEDYGNTWTDIGQGLPDVPANAAVFDPLYPSVIYVGNDIGVFLSLDGGQNWTDFNDGLPDALIAMDLSISGMNRKLRIASHGNGAWERDLFDASSQITGGDEKPTDFVLRNNYPNPFNATTQISYRLPMPVKVELAIFDLQGRRVRTLVDDVQGSGDHVRFWDGKDDAGMSVATGTYFYRLRAGDFSKTRRLTLLR